MSEDIRLSRDQRDGALIRLKEAVRGAQRANDMMDEAFCDFLGVNRTDGRCLDIVDERGQMTAGELAREVGITSGAVTALIDRLEAAGFLQRKNDPSDRRKVLIELTPEAKRLGEEVYGPLAHAGMPYLESLEDHEILTLIGYLETSRRINIEMAEAIQARTPARAVVSLRYRMEQARALKNDAKKLFKTIKSDVKDLISVVAVTGGSTWTQDENGKWVESKPVSLD
jgi:DNA-binding MarR family transcriptional regulator